MPNTPLAFDLTRQPVATLAALAPRWRALEAAADGGFFLSWAFLQCQAARFNAPYLLAARRGGQDVALALLNRRRGRLHLTETGDPRQDALFIEHNGLLLRRGAEDVLEEALAQLCAQAPVVLSGVNHRHAEAAARVGTVIMHAKRFAPHIRLQALPDSYLASLSPNARGQIARSLRLYGDDLMITRAPDSETALAWFAALARLHQARWQAAGAAGAFADAAQRHFHENLIRAAHGHGESRGKVDIMRIAAGAADIGYLYNMRHGAMVLNYQGGFTAADNAQLKPGLVCHTLAVEFYRAEGAAIYDLLAGAQRYKKTLAPANGQDLFWLTLYDRRSLAGQAHRAATALKRMARRGRPLPAPAASAEL